MREEGKETSSFLPSERRSPSLEVLFCVYGLSGETLEARNEGNTHHVLSRQLQVKRQTQHWHWISLSLTVSLSDCLSAFLSRRSEEFFRLKSGRESSWRMNQCGRSALERRPLQTRLNKLTKVQRTSSQQQSVERIPKIPFSFIPSCVISEIRKWIRENVGPEVAEEIRIIYGGSVKGANAKAGFPFLRVIL